MRSATMAHYFFDLHECGTPTMDPEGRDFATLDDARTAAIADARAIMCGEIDHGTLCLACYIDVSDEQHVHLIRVLFKDAVEVSG